MKKGNLYNAGLLDRFQQGDLVRVTSGPRRGRVGIVFRPPELNEWQFIDVLFSDKGEVRAINALWLENLTEGRACKSELHVI